MSARRHGEPVLPDYMRVMQKLAIHASKRGVEIDVTTNTERKRAVLSHPDLAERLCEHPLGYVRPDQWTGYIPPEMWQGQPNRSPRRDALVAIYEEASARAEAGAHREAA